MTQARKLKQRIRARMEKTGESYAAARQQVVGKVDAVRQARTKEAADRAARAPATGAVTEARCREKTGRGFEHWFEVLDRFGPAEGHTAAARHLRADHGVSAWYAQAITVSWERARGIRVENQTGEGSFQVSVTRVLPRSADAVADALGDAAFVERWLGGTDPEAAAAVRSGLAARSVKRAGTAHTVRFPGLEGRVDIRITAKADGRSSIAVQLRKLATRERVDANRASWRAHLDRLRVALGD